MAEAKPSIHQSAPKFCKRHYEAIALAMQEAHPVDLLGKIKDPTQACVEEAEREQWQRAVAQLANVLARDNGEFKRVSSVRVSRARM